MASFASGYIKYINHLEQINDAVFGNVDLMIQEIEESYHEHLAQIAEHIVCSKKRIKIIMLAGPSSSGKTTTAHCLKKYISETGRNVSIVSLDDFYLEKSQIPVLPDGTIDFDTVDALDISGIKSCIKKITEEGGRVEIPKFSFELSRPLDEPQILNIDEDDVVIIEGIHALNPIFVDNISQDTLVRIYVSVKQPIKDENGIVMSPSDIRLVRRIVRDVQFRNSPPEKTLNMWDMVERGEDRYIRPYRFTADFTVNSIHLYEPCVLRTMAIPMLRAIERDSSKYRKARELEGKLMRFESINKTLVPSNSILREFIGND